MFEKQKGCVMSLQNILTIVMICILCTICHRVKAQSWANENRGLYPNSIQLTLNVPNEMIGLTYGYLFQQPVLSMPIGIYGEYVSTLPKQWHSPNYFKYNNYNWQHKYSIGLSITLPYSSKSNGLHVMGTIGINYYEVPVANPDIGLKPGQYSNEEWLRVSTAGCDIGVKAQLNHFTMHIKTDIINWMRYTQAGCGYTF